MLERRRSLRRTSPLVSYHEAMAPYDVTTALIVVDVQNDFADPAGSLYVRGGEDVVPVANEHIEAALQGGARVLYTQDWHPPSTPHFVTDGGIWPVHCVAETWGADLHPDLLIRGPVVRKGSNGEDGYSGFTMRDPQTGETRATDLADRLREAGIQMLVVCGLATDYCVKATALDARGLGWSTILLAAGTRAVDLEPGDGERALDEMRAAGVVVEEDPDATRLAP
ncbi:bifunctional nicotinamidase/pyrazinamidase [soil metagenome]